VRTEEPIAGRSKFTGGLCAADERGIELEQDGQRLRIGYGATRRSNLVLEPAGGAG
jgi:ribosome maturation factor RimP